MKNLELFLLLTGATVPGASPVLGHVTAANTSTLGFGAQMAQDISGYLAGPTADDMEPILDALFPPVETDWAFQFPKADDDAFVTELDDSDIRALGGSFKRVENRGTTVTDSTIQKGLTKRVEHRTLPKDSNGRPRGGWENGEAASLKYRLIRAEFYRGLGVLDGAANADTKTWSAATNPDGDLRAMVERTRVKSGLPATHCVLGSGAQQLRQDSYEGATKVNVGTAPHANYTMEQLATYLGVEKVHKILGVYQTAKEGTKTNFANLLAYSYSARPGATINDPSNIKRAWSASLSGSRWTVYIVPGADWTDITVFHNSKIFAPITNGVEKLTVSA